MPIGKFRPLPQQRPPRLTDTLGDGVVVFENAIAQNRPAQVLPHVFSAGYNSGVAGGMYTSDRLPATSSSAVMCHHRIQQGDRRARGPQWRYDRPAAIYRGARTHAEAVQARRTSIQPTSKGNVGWVRPARTSVIAATTGTA